MSSIEAMNVRWIDRVNVGICILAVNGIDDLRAIAMNSMLCSLLSCEYPIGRRLEEYLPENLVETLRVHANRCLENGTPIGTQVLVADTPYTLFFSPSRDCATTNELPNVVVTWQQDKLVESSSQSTNESRLRQLLDKSSDAIIVVDGKGIVHFINNTAEKLFNRSADEMIGELFGMPVVAGERTDVEIVRKGGEMASAEMRVVETTEDGKLAYVVATLRDISERKQFEESIRLRERAIAASSNGIVITDCTKPLNPIIYASPGFERITGYSAKDVIGLNCRFLQRTDRDQPALDVLRGAIREGKECHVILSNYRKDGTHFWNELYVSPVFNEHGELTNFIGIQTDVTDRFNAQEQLRESEARLRTVLAAIKEGITFSDAKGYFEFFNPEMEVLTGYTMAEANACEDFNLLIYPDSPERQIALYALQQLRNPGDTFESETKILTKQGETKNVLVSSTAILYQGKLMYLSAYRDITERKQVEDLLRRQSERERLLNEITLRLRQGSSLDSTLAVAVEETARLLRVDRVVIYQFHADGTGMVTVESVGYGWRSLLDNQIRDRFLDNAVRDAYFTGTYQEFFLRGNAIGIDDTAAPGIHPCHRRMLEELQVKSNLVAPIVFGGALWGLLAAHQCAFTRKWQPYEIELMKQLANHVAISIQNDGLFQQVQALNSELLTLNADLEHQVSERTSQLQQALAKERELGELKSRFVSMASHEFRTPLATIQAASDLLLRYNHKMTEDKKVERLHKIQTEVKNMTELLEDVLTIGKIGAGKLELKAVRVDFEEFCKSILEEVELLLPETQTLRFHASNDCRQLTIDTKLMRQALINLIGNAIKYSPQGGDIEVVAQCSPAQLVISVRDEGIGIPPDDRDKLFESFFRARNVGNISGTGLGLAIAKAAVELHGGTIAIDSQLSVGTKFTVTIPLRGNFNKGSETNGNDTCH